MTTEEKIIAGICCDCGGAMKPLSREEIDEIKDDIGMGPEDEFFDCCEECEKQYIPQHIQLALTKVTTDTNTTTTTGTW